MQVVTIAGQPPESDVVRCGGIAQSDAETEDVTRDTYGFPASAPVQSNRQERITNAEREAEQAGMPGVELPESPEEVKNARDASLPQGLTMAERQR